MGGLLCITAVTTFNDVLRRPRERRQVPVRAGVHLVRRVGGDPVVRRRQVDPDARRLGAHRAARRSSRSASSSTRSRTACTRRPSATSSRRYALFIALVPVLFFNFVGFELPNAAGRRDEGPAAGRARSPSCARRSRRSLLYGMPILAILLVLPADQITSLGGFIDAMKTVFTVYGGDGHADGRRDADRRGQGARRPHGRRLHPRAALERHDVADGLRPHAGRRRLRRRGPARPRLLLLALRHADRRQLPQRRRSRRS